MNEERRRDPYIQWTTTPSLKRVKKRHCSNTCGPRDDHPQRSQSEGERQMSYDTTYIWNLKYCTNEPVCKTETNSQTQKSGFELPSSGERNGLGVWYW